MIVASIIVLNYNGKNIIAETIETLLNLDFPKDKLEIIIADNNSPDKSYEIIQKYPVKYIQNGFNYGFAKGNNLAIKEAQGKYIVLLNNDCIVEKNWLNALIKTAESDPKIFSVTSKIKTYPPESNQVQNAGSIVFQDGYGRDIGAIVSKAHQQSYEKDTNQFNTDKEIYSSCGAAVLYKKDILNKIGLLDENFFMYYEDTEISERARLAGYKNYYSYKAIVFHHHAKSSGEWSPLFIYNVERGRLLHILYHFPLQIFFKEFIKYTIKSKLRFFRHPSKYIYLKVSIDIIKNFLKYFSRRKKFKSIYSPSTRGENFQKILSGYWYFN